MGSISTPQKASNYDEIFMQHSLQFAESLKELKILKKQLYSAAEYFESSYGKDDHQILVMESSKDYVAKALVSTVDHLGSVADKLNKFLDEKADEFSVTTVRFSCLEQKLHAFQGFVDLRGTSQHSLIVEAPKHHKQYIAPEFGKSKLVFGNCILSPLHDMHQIKKDNPFSRAFQAAQTQPQLALSRKGLSRVSSSESPQNFSFTRVMSKKETGKRSVSPLGFTLKRSGSVANRSVSPSPFDSKHRVNSLLPITFTIHANADAVNFSYVQRQSPSEPPRAMSVHRNREGQIVESYTKRSNNFFKALLNAHRSRKENHKLQIIPR